MTTGGGGWTVIQRRVDESVDFYRNWADYEGGFGDLEGNYWIGLKNMHALTQTPTELYVYLENFNGATAYARYASFTIGDVSTNYVLRVGRYSGTAGDSFIYHDGCSSLPTTMTTMNTTGTVQNVRKVHGGSGGSRVVSGQI